MYYWVIQVHKGEVSAVGPYRSEEACRNRYDRVQGGEIFEFTSQSSDPKEVIDEFKSDNTGGGI